MSSTTSDHPKVFISYSHDSREHKDRVWSFLIAYVTMASIATSISMRNRRLKDGRGGWLTRLRTLTLCSWCAPKIMSVDSEEWRHREGLGGEMGGGNYHPRGL